MLTFLKNKFFLGMVGKQTTKKFRDYTSFLIKKTDL